MPGGPECCRLGRLAAMVPSLRCVFRECLNAPCLIMSPCDLLWVMLAWKDVDASASCPACHHFIITATFLPHLCEGNAHGSQPYLWTVLRCTAVVGRGPAEKRLLWSCSVLAQSARSLGGAAARGQMGLAFGQGKLGGESRCGCGAWAHRKAQPPRRPGAWQHQVRCLTQVCNHKQGRLCSLTALTSQAGTCSEECCHAERRKATGLV